MAVEWKFHKRDEVEGRLLETTVMVSRPEPGRSLFCIEVDGRLAGTVPATNGDVAVGKSYPVVEAHLADVVESCRLDLEAAERSLAAWRAARP